MHPRKVAVIAFLVLIALYTLFQARFLILGPRLTIESPHNGAVLDNDVVVIKGTAENIAYLTLNGRQIYTDTKGNWSEKLVAPKGTSIMTVSARDRFGRSTERRVTVVLN